jgi:hypothetical protein
LLGPVVSWTASEDSSLSELPMPPDRTQRVLAARPDETGRAVLRWSRKEKVPQNERDLAKTEVRRLVEAEIQRGQDDPHFVKGAESQPGWIQTQVTFTPARVMTTVMVLKEARAKSEEVYSSAVDEVVQRLRACGRSRDVGPAKPPRLGRIQYHDETLNADRDKFRKEIAEQRAAPSQPLEPHEEKALVDDFVANMPAAVLSATHQVCRGIAVQMDQLSPEELARVQKGVEEEMVKGECPWDFLKDLLREPPKDGAHCMMLHYLSTKMLAAREPNATLPDSTSGRLELIREAVLRFGPKDRAGMDLESALVGAVFSPEYVALKYGDKPRALIDFEALSKAVQHPETRAALEKSLEWAKAAMKDKESKPPSEASTSRPSTASTDTVSPYVLELLKPATWTVDRGIVRSYRDLGPAIFTDDNDPWTELWWRQHEVPDETDLDDLGA